MELRIKTLTPLWTGGVEASKVDRIHETGILGSLRWWYETIVRGLGGEACDPSRGECRFDAEKYARSQASDERKRLCDVCQVFGATGWRRRFRMSVVEENVSNAQIQDKVALQHRQYTDNKGKPRTPTWYFRDPTQPNTVPNTPKIGCFSIKVISLATDFPPEVIAGLIQFIAKWAALGARAQMGFGVIELDKRVDTEPLCKWLAQVVGSNHYPHLPSLQNIFLARIAPRNGAQFNERDTFNLKYDLRQRFTGQQNSDLRHFIMGTVKGKRMAAKVKMSRPYNNGREMHVWGWIPEEANVYRDSWNREKVVDVIYQHLNKNYTLQVWREMDSPRDTVTPNNRDALAFLRSLLGLQEEDNDAA